ncbi:hypothetical protein RRG08_035143 [Elysia crispata]|uniref:Uncharacterized protein n=1 Tax=Elysia crispata TaxID=231223 RepID=A0AAE1E1J2_9GAST|nr:hypothetical protein RRG08_035143 [Elysia crispata]
MMGEPGRRGERETAQGGRKTRKMMGEPGRRGERETAQGGRKTRKMMGEPGRRGERETAQGGRKTRKMMGEPGRRGERETAQGDIRCTAVKVPVHADIDAPSDMGIAWHQRKSDLEQLVCLKGTD